MSHEEKLGQKEIERAIGRLFIAVSNAQTVTIAAIAALKDESEAKTYKRLWRADLRDIADDAIKLIKERVHESPERTRLLEDLAWLCDRSGEFWSLRNDLAHGAIYVHGNTQRWAVGRPWVDEKGPTDRKRYIDPDEIKRFHRRIWRYVGDVMGIILFTTGRAKPDSDVVFMRERCHGTYVTLLVNSAAKGLNSADLRHSEG